MSEFVNDAICKELVSEKEELRQAYFESNKDEGQCEEAVEWETTIADGLDKW
jgi:hypothetical protein